MYDSDGITTESATFLLVKIFGKNARLQKNTYC